MPVVIKFSTEGKVSIPYEGMSKKNIFSAARKAMEGLGLDNVSISLIFTDNTVIKKINKKFRNKDYSTDVISFAYREYSMPAIPSSREHLGDIFISLPKAKAQAKTFGVSFQDEIKRLIVHALCHCLGYDHEISKKEEIKMQKKEDQILRYISQA